MMLEYAGLFLCQFVLLSISYQLPALVENASACLVFLPPFSCLRQLSFLCALFFVMAVYHRSTYDKIAKAKSPRAASSSSSSSTRERDERSELELLKKSVGTGAAAGAAFLNNANTMQSAQERVPENVPRPQRVIKRTAR